MLVNAGGVERRLRRREGACGTRISLRCVTVSRFNVTYTSSSRGKVLELMLPIAAALVCHVIGVFVLFAMEEIRSLVDCWKRSCFGDPGLRCTDATSQLTTIQAKCCNEKKVPNGSRIVRRKEKEDIFHYGGKEKPSLSGTKGESRGREKAGKFRFGLYEVPLHPEPNKESTALHCLSNEPQRQDAVQRARRRLYSGESLSEIHSLVCLLCVKLNHLLSL